MTFTHEIVVAILSVDTRTDRIMGEIGFTIYRKMTSSSQSVSNLGEIFFNDVVVDVVDLDM